MKQENQITVVTMIMYDVKNETMNDPCDERKEKHLH
jgi:hypothetical protein